jgi:hypothetical protein
MTKTKEAGNVRDIFELFPPIEPQPGSSYFSLTVSIGGTEEELILQEVPDSIQSLFFEYVEFSLQRQINEGATVAGIRASSVGVAEIMVAPGVIISEATENRGDRYSPSPRLADTIRKGLAPGKLIAIQQERLPPDIPNLLIEGLTEDCRPFEAELNYHPKTTQN